ncbi:MAG: DUF5329 family protein [Candidatus Omnitrophica bacterium]|nr:DUF5329 family protein [Candidatus Omnitrophota bacterium]
MVMPKWVIFLWLIIYGFIGCASTPKENGVNTDEEITPWLYLHDPAVHEERIQNFIEKHTEFKEMDKIRYLLDGMRTSKAIFIRNEREGSGSMAAKWLRWKMVHPQFFHNPILTGEDFVERVADRSKRTGRYYEIILEKGVRDHLQTVLRNELDDLEEAIQKAKIERVQKALMEAESKRGEMLPEEKQETAKSALHHGKISAGD